MKNKDKKSKNKSNKNKNKDIELSEEKEEDNQKQLEEIINTDLPKKKNINKKSKKNNQNKKTKKKSQKEEEENEINEEDLNLVNAVVLNPSNLSSIPKLTRIVEEEKISENNNQKVDKEEFKIAKYFTQTKLIEPKNTNKDLLFIPEEDAILSLCD